MTSFHNLSRRLFLYGIISILIAAAGSCATDSAELARDYYNLGVGYLEQGQYAQAQEYFARALDLDPGLTRASYNLARAHLLLGRPEQAMLVLQDLLQEDPDNILVRETLAYANGAAGYWEEAAFIMEQITDEHSISVRGWVNYTVALIELERCRSAYDAAGQALRLEPEHEQAQLMVIVSAAHIPDRLEEHEVLLQKVLERVPESRSITLALGDALEHAERYDAAIELYDNSSSKYPEDGEISFRHARLLITIAEDHQAGVTALSRAVSQGFSDRDKLSDLLSRVDVEIPAALQEQLEGDPADQEEEDTGEDMTGADE